MAATKWKSDGFTHTLLECHYLRGPRLLVGHRGAGTWHVWSQDQERHLTTFATPSLALRRCVGEDGQGRGVLLTIGEEEEFDSDGSGLSLYDLESGSLVWRRRDLRLAGTLRVGKAGDTAVVSVESAKGTRLIDLRTGGVASASSRAFVPQKRARIPKRWDLDFPLPHHLPTSLFSRKERQFRRGLSQSELEILDAQHAFYYGPDASPAAPSWEHSSLQNGLSAELTLMRHLEGRPLLDLNAAVDECRDEVCAMLGPVPDDVVALFAVRSTWLREKWALDPNSIRQSQALFESFRRKPPPLMPIGRSEDGKSVLCVSQGSDAPMLGVLGRSSYTGPESFVSWASSQLWDFADAGGSMSTDVVQDQCLRIHGLRADLG